MTEIATKELPTTEVWWRNPSNYIKELVEVPAARNVIWDRGFLAKRGIDAWAHAALYFGKTPDWKVLVCGEQGTAMLDYQHDLRNPIAVFPTWDYAEDDMSILEQMIANPMGQDHAACAARLPPDEKPVLGQEHRVFITNLPASSLNLTKNLLRHIRELTEEYEHLNPKIHLHATYAYTLMFSMGFYSTDIDPRTDAQKGKIILPPGKVIKFEAAAQNAHWVNLLDMTPPELKIPRNRCIFNIKSGLWAGQYWTKNLTFKTVGKTDLDPRDKVLKSAPGARVVLGNSTQNKPQPGDQIACNSCSLQTHCKYFRTDAVCSIPETEMSELAKYFNSRDSSRIIDGMGQILGAAAARLERGIELEEDFGELDPEVTKMMNMILNQGRNLAKLIDPSLAKPTLSLTVNQGGSGQPQSARQVTSQVVRAILDENPGMEVKDVTADMVGNMLARMGSQDAAPAVAIEANK
jgi:hypothetical protein